MTAPSRHDRQSTATGSRKAAKKAPRARRRTDPPTVADLAAIPSFDGPLPRLLAYADTLFLDHAIFRAMYPNFHYLSGKMARSNGPLPYQLGWAAEKGIRTIVNLRGRNRSNWYYLEAEACRHHGLTLIDFPVRSRDVPARTLVHDAAALFETLDYPALMHCKSGADRVGLMSALYLVLHEGRPVREAMDQLSFWYGHVKSGRTGFLDHFFRSYLRDAEGRELTFLDWVDHHYDPEEARQTFRPRWWGSLLVDHIFTRE